MKQKDKSRAEKRTVDWVLIPRAWLLFFFPHILFVSSILSVCLTSERPREMRRAVLFQTLVSRPFIGGNKREMNERNIAKKGREGGGEVVECDTDGWSGLYS